MSACRKIAIAGMIVMLLAGCEVLPDRFEVPEHAGRPVQKKKPAEPTAQQKKQAELAARQQECLNSVKELKDVLARWEEAERLAGSAPRIILPKRLEVLQKIRQELQDSPASPCSDKAKADLARSMDLTTNFFTNFLSNDRAYLAAESARTTEGTSDRQVARQLMDAVAAELARIEACKGAC